MMRFYLIIRLAPFYSNNGVTKSPILWLRLNISKNLTRVKQYQATLGPDRLNNRLFYYLSLYFFIKLGKVLFINYIGTNMV
jgi:hypothetical protein